MSEIKEQNPLGNKRHDLRVISDDYNVAIKSQVTEIGESAEQLGKTVMMVGGVLLVGYGLMRLLFDFKEEESAVSTKKAANFPVISHPSGGSRIFNSIMEQMALFLLAIAKEQLTKLVKKD